MSEALEDKPLMEEDEDLQPKLFASVVMAWWRNRDKLRLDGYMDKAQAYGSYDLELIGSTLRDIMDVSFDAEVTDEELGVIFYALGKMARIVSAIKDGKAPSEDSWHDLEVYARMAALARVRGDL